MTAQLFRSPPYTELYPQATPDQILALEAATKAWRSAELDAERVSAYSKLTSVLNTLGTDTRFQGH